MARPGLSDARRGIPHPSQRQQHLAAFLPAAHPCGCRHHRRRLPKKEQVLGWWFGRLVVWSFGFLGV